MQQITPSEARIERKRRNVTQPVVAEMIGVARNTSTLWECGKRDLPKGAHIALTAWANGEASASVIGGAERLFSRGLREVLAIVEGDLPSDTKRELIRNGIKNLGILFALWDGAE